MKTNVSEGIERALGLGFPRTYSAQLFVEEVTVAKGNLSLSYLLVYFSWHWKNFPFPPGCSNSHLLTAFHAGLQLTLGRRFPCSPFTLHSGHREVFILQLS